ncbi:hypothetical protein HTT03_06205 [Sulfitobacter sp. S0837]|uniref:hypothetical protein n=1 Tax=Sulfitobacter maritimus TaxID=2741719 RepID=UPI0015822701|nr:hypothetical protein [Sulfitobacter maritimus]NUH64891.1 hypothetical protein [Sulfitobacter maritimus]
MKTLLPEGKRIRIRSFYGFGPEDDGYVGWTQENARDAYLRKLNDGDLIMTYGASTAETENSLRSYVLGFLEVDATPIRDLDLSQFDAAPLIAFTATKEMNYGTETDGRIPPGCGAYRTDEWADAQAGG